MLTTAMTMISYAQNAEDVVLMRTLGALGSGFYVDVGAWHPTWTSVTKAFYDIGWSGINVEPQVHCLAQFEIDRPRDINLGIALSDRQGMDSLWVPRFSALATCRPELVDPGIPDYGGASRVDVETRTLDSVLAQYAHGREIHFLKIDVEGYERLVIRGSTFKEFRPWVLVIEATSPHTNAPTWQDWEPYVLERGYLFALFDGLNRFYVRHESGDLLPTLAVPANCLDGYITQRERRTRRRLASALTACRRQRAAKACGEEVESHATARRR
jgi:FkbM family methyltransferase